MSPALVAMLDLSDFTLHKPGTVHLVTACGIGPLAEATVGPALTVWSRSERICTSCWSSPMEFIEAADNPGQWVQMLGDMLGIEIPEDVPFEEVMEALEGILEEQKRQRREQRDD